MRLSIVRKILFFMAFLCCSIQANERLAGMRKVKEAIVKTSIITYRKADVSAEDIHNVQFPSPASEDGIHLT